MPDEGCKMGPRAEEVTEHRYSHDGEKGTEGINLLTGNPLIPGNIRSVPFSYPDMSSISFLAVMMPLIGSENEARSPMTVRETLLSSRRSRNQPHANSSHGPCLRACWSASCNSQCWPSPPSSSPDLSQTHPAKPRYP